LESVLLNNDRLLTSLTADIFTACVAGNRVAAGDLPGLILSVHTALRSAEATADGHSAPEQERATAAQIRKSITRDALISFEDGRAYKSMTRHLSIRGLTPAAYRAKWGLPSDYPMVAAASAARRANIAKQAGFGRRKSGSATEPVAISAPTPTPLAARSPAGGA
jgi:predicted transcriptional regulator